MTSLLGDLFGVSKPIIAMVHLPALPGRPRHDRDAGMRRVTDTVARDLAALQDAGVDGLLFCNEADLPYQIGVGPEAAAAMAAVIGAVRRELSRPFGLNLVWDPVASLAVARATGASFVREVFTGVYESDLGIMQPDFGAIAAYRSGIGAEQVALFANITPEFASSVGHRTIAQRARSTAFLGVDALLISGAITGQPTDLTLLREARAAAGDTPVLANTGVTAGTVSDVLSVADGAIVGTSLKADGSTWSPVDPVRAVKFMAAARDARAGAAGVQRW
ncbi:MAG TPA: BtpA/SgcQ family protein [Streptosporangiaceae bacterium]|nr:BtpA/SgcQ family protein [Streptosporangiaceae bacterium]